MHIKSRSRLSARVNVGFAPELFLPDQVALDLGSHRERLALGCLLSAIDADAQQTVVEKRVRRLITSKEFLSAIDSCVEEVVPRAQVAAGTGHRVAS